MDLTLKNYNYCYVNAIGSTLRRPLFKLTYITTIGIAPIDKPLENPLWRVAKKAFHLLVLALFVIPAGLSWLIGKSISYFSKTKIHPEGLFLAPAPISIPNELQSDQSIDIMLLSKKFKTLNVLDERLSDQTSKKDCLHRLCEWTNTENTQIYFEDPQKRSLFCKQLSLFLKDIVKKIDSGQIYGDKERDILMELAEASTRCYPTWLEVAAKLFAEVNGQSETVEVKLLRLIQEYKESLILEFGQQELDSQWHALNYVRNILGNELGLNTTLNVYDPYAGHNHLTFSKTLTKWLFLEIYENINRFISSVQTKINFQSYDPSYHDFLVLIIQQRGIKDPEDYVANHFYDANHRLNEAGTNLMLRSIGILK